MARASAPYMEWAKHRPRPAIDLAGSNLLACELSDLPGARESIALEGESPDGYRPLVDAIARAYGMLPENVATASGCSGANFLALASLIEGGDDVLIERPFYDPLVAAVEMLGGRVRHFERRFEEGFAIDPSRVAGALTDRTRAIVISSPHNPSGVLATDDALDGLERVAADAGIAVLVDEVYLDVVFQARPVPAAKRSPVFVSSNSLTKAYGLSSLRCGWTLASPERTRRIRRARDVVDVSGPIPAERLSRLAFDRLEALSLRAHRIAEQNLAAFRLFLDARPELECAPFAATVAFPRFRDGRDAGPFADALMRNHGVAVVPGSFFGEKSHFRVALGGAPDAVATGLAAITRTLDDGGALLYQV